MWKELTLCDRSCLLYENEKAEICLIQPIDDHDLEDMNAELEYIRSHTSVPFCLLAFRISDWNDDLSPWPAPAVFGSHDFGGKAEETLKFMMNELIPAYRALYPDREFRFMLGGYSLAGFFSLWTAYQTSFFEGIAACSPSVWFEGWYEYIQEHQIHTGNIYLSLGTKEEKARNRTMARVGDHIRFQHELLTEDENVHHCILEWNPGNHFKDSGLRTARGFTWLLNL